MAFIKAGDGPYVVGLGPFTSHAAAPDAGTAFYCNDFTLSDPEPWKVPTETREVESLEEIGLAPVSSSVTWQDLDPEGFAAIFAEINEMIGRGVIEKSVPVATEHGTLESGHGCSLMGNLTPLGAPFYSYGWSDGERGFCGGTPELLFELDGRQLSTMALAGTAKADEREVFAVDGKEIREHEFVAQTLVAKLSDIGSVTRAERSIMDLGQLVHFHTSIEVELFALRGVDELIRRLHPTPALGPLPRTEQTLQMLADWRQRMQCPEQFGAPFGLLKDGTFRSVVAIRGLHWQGAEVAIPSGCGVIEASRLVNEWRELRLKREAVKAALGL
ncbi:chorismate-binding protein [Verrucomicrobiaceae bacterium 5K15]|uniref:Chorismate-binding protein n=1 Tax=Oceaniferula flava TaxID=2800421 RepID=A0AAE2S928_9BACT|nr:chorismate-binding protein [Oceaniferula flavus]MBK1853415.1 chorismate-binding protein [Oceaniferula flavus]MBM1134720.1 chorismate-binding protein [Oceaniferula flavus]